ncbi:MAG: hypothetical protein KBA46_06375 [Candidatus Omnitrophica bacterium]|nr:hypothetical protein [Candidatus Omnitrophota bacterium]
MRRIFIVMGLVIFFAQASFAHPPSRIEINFNSETLMLTAKITHPVADAESHHIKKVDVAVNGKEILEHKISKQDNTTDQLVEYRIPDAKSGDRISVEGYCNISGKNQEEITIE